MAAMAQSPVTIRRGWLWAEFAALFVGVPLGVAVFLPPGRMFLALFAFSLLGMALLWRTGGFEWRSLLRGWSEIRWGKYLIFALLVGLIGWGIMWLTHPGYALNLSPQRLRFLALIWMLYPLLSALPQELIFRALYFHRYGQLFRTKRQAIAVNAVIFSLAHLMYWSWIVAGMTFFGGWLFAHIYLKRGFPGAWLLHALAGNMIFAVGMGAYFYSGNAVRPF
ncbi:CPBP family intramembrane glutamic endopeptidase [Paracoccus aminophilus]|uniref:Protease n=1 Tax=Paracoccus aminophilus JCM 7686 TaxID=1367847 RepID=S5XW45_PARAH|nr:CPBP family intramembrane glutamic endopeptidase [Paracoccus aminophilus]AGT09512.1 protease [Paracoccus aminophilus JCM 7686]